MIYYKRKFVLLGSQLGFSIGKDCFGYGLVIHHPGTIVVGSNNTIGNYALINTSTCITKNGSQIGDGFFFGSGANIIKTITLGNDTWIGANSVVNQSFPDGDVLVAGVPGKIVKENAGSWYNTLYGERWNKRYLKVEELRRKMFG